MADSSTPASVTELSELTSAKVHVSGANRLRVEFKIDDLVKRLLPGNEAADSCGGCRGCMGCSMIEFSAQTER
jgi:hypothetical protein